MASLVRHLRLLPVFALLALGLAWVERPSSAATQVASEGSTMPRAGTKGLLEIRGFFDGTRATMTRLGPAPEGIRETVGPPSSPMQIWISGPDNRLLHTLPLHVSGLHGNPEPLGKSQHLAFDGVLPSAEALEIQLRYQGAVVFDRTRPRHAPQVVFHEPASGTTLSASPTSGGSAAPESIKVTWTATHADHLPLYAYVDFSSNSGASWHNVYMGPNKNHASFPAHLLALSALNEARIRVRVNDGFNETTATSGPLTVIDLEPAT